MEVTELTWADRILLEGREQGREEGRQEGQRALIRTVAMARFGAVPPALEARLTAAADEEALRLLAQRVATAASAADLD